MALVKASKMPIQSTAGAIPIRNEKGEITMEKVKVQRYVSGKRPDYAPQDSSDEEEEMEFHLHQQKKLAGLPVMKTDAEREDRRLRRLQQLHADREEGEEEEEKEEPEDRITRHRRLHEPELLGRSSDEEEVEDEEQPMEAEESSEEEEEELDEEEIERRRGLLRMKARQREEAEHELMDKEEEKSEGESESESSEYEEYTDSEEEETAPRLKPVFVRKKDRITIQEKENEVVKKQEMEIEVKKLAEERRRQTLRMVEDEARKAMEEERGLKEAFEAVNTDDDNDEEEYELWKIRELKRIKRDREERENEEKEKLESEKLRNMTEEERQKELKAIPRVITNKAEKGKYKFLQKYYHRGAFFLDKEESVLRRDFSAPTLEDHFNKSVLPKVMQVKNFGRSGRTKYTHLADQDTSQFQETPWSDSALAHKFHATRAGGMKQVFERPSVRKQKTAT